MFQSDVNTCIYAGAAESYYRLADIASALSHRGHLRQNNHPTLLRQTDTARGGRCPATCGHFLNN